MDSRAQSSVRQYAASPAYLGDCTILSMAYQVLIPNVVSLVSGYAIGRGRSRVAGSTTCALPRFRCVWFHLCLCEYLYCSSGPLVLGKSAANSPNRFLDSAIR
jgi:hypothetical protein